MQRSVTKHASKANSKISKLKVTGSQSCGKNHGKAIQFKIYKGQLNRQKKRLLQYLLENV